MVLDGKQDLVTYEDKEIKGVHARFPDGWRAFKQGLKQGRLKDVSGFMRLKQMIDDGQMPESNVLEAKQLLENPLLSVEMVMQSSSAAAGLCRFMHVLVEYYEWKKQNDEDGSSRPSQVPLPAKTSLTTSLALKQAMVPDARAADAASSVLVSINKGDITEIKSFSNPPAQVKMTMEAVCILLGHKPDWPTAKKLLKMPDFLTQLIKYDKDNIDPKKIEQLQEYVTKDDFNPTNIGKVSKAASVLCKWCCAMEDYNRVAKEVEPRQPTSKTTLHASKLNESELEALEFAFGRKSRVVLTAYVGFFSLSARVYTHDHTH